jgi:hypothetical protein
LQGHSQQPTRNDRHGIFAQRTGISLIGTLTATVASYFVGQDLDRDKTDRAMLTAELEQSRADRENLSLKLDLLQAQLAELLNRM